MVTEGMFSMFTRTNPWSLSWTRQI